MTLFRRFDRPGLLDDLGPASIVIGSASIGSRVERARLARSRTGAGFSVSEQSTTLARIRGRAEISERLPAKRGRR